MTHNITDKKINAAVDILLASDKDLPNILGKEGLLKDLSKRILARALEIEMQSHLGYERYARSASDNARNGNFTKNLATEHGTLTLNVPRDRKGDFEPMIVKKGQSRISGLDDTIISLYAKGMSVSDIKIQLEELYNTEISESLISRVTDEVIDQVKSWQNRALEAIYPIVFFDCIVVKVKQDKRIINKSVYVSLGIDSTGEKDILGLWISDTEGAKFWLNNLTELKNRGLSEILISCSDNLPGMSEAIAAVYPHSEHQLGIVHQIRNSLTFVSYKDRKQVGRDLKPIYQAVNDEEALDALKSFEDKWGKQYPQIAKSWYNNWEHLIAFLKYPQCIRKVIYTTHAIESLNNQLRKVTRNKRVFPSDDAVFKSLYLTIEYITAKWTIPVANWHEVISHFLIRFEDRIHRSSKGIALNLHN